MKGRDDKLNDVFNALSNKHRRDMVYRLSLGPTSISSLANEIGLSLPAIHKHIAVLENAHLLQRKRVGRSNFVALNRDALQAVHAWINQYHSYWGNNSESLENYISRIEEEKK